MRLEVQYGNIGIFSKYSKEKYVNLLILTFPIEWCYFQLHKLSRSRDTDPKNSCFHWTEHNVHTYASLTWDTFVKIRMGQKSVTDRQTNHLNWLIFTCWNEWCNQFFARISRSEDTPPPFISTRGLYCAPVQCEWDMESWLWEKVIKIHKKGT